MTHKKLLESWNIKRYVVIKTPLKYNLRLSKDIFNFDKIGLL